MTEPPTTSDTLSKCLAESIPKQDEQIVEDMHAFVDALPEYRRQTVDPAEFLDRADPVDAERETAGTIVAETVTCSNKNCHYTNSGGAEHGPHFCRY